MSEPLIKIMPSIAIITFPSVEEISLASTRLVTGTIFHHRPPRYMDIPISSIKLKLEELQSIHTPPEKKHENHSETGILVIRRSG